MFDLFIMKKFLIKTKKSTLVFLTLTFIFIPILVLAEDSSIGGMVNQTAQSAGFQTATDPQSNFAATAGRIASIFISLIGIIFISYIIYGGFLWLTAGGNEEKVAQAKKIIQHGIIGLIVILSAAAIYVFIKNALIQNVSNSGGLTGPRGS